MRAPTAVHRLLVTAALAGLAPVGAMAGSEKVLYAFQGSAADDGDTPYAVPTRDGKGNLYGTTLYGGADGDGIVYELVHSKSGWKEEVLHSFSGGNDGEFPYGGVVLDKSGNVYGGTQLGGSNFSGIVYELSPGARGKWRETILFTFPGNQQSQGGPVGALTFDNNGNLFGTTVGGGACNYGTVFELRRTRTGWKHHTLHEFCGSDGQAPAYGQLVFDPAGNIYGTTGFGGSGGRGVVFELTPAAHHQWTFAKIHEFTSDEGGVADGGLTIDANGNLYGAEADGGANVLGSVYELSPAGGGVWNENILYVFQGSPDGSLPFQNPVFDLNGNLFGTTYSGGQTSQCQGCGAIYELVPQTGGSWSETLVYDFATQSGGADGYQPVAGLMGDANGNFYGTATKGGNVGEGACACGAIYEFTP